MSKVTNTGHKKLEAMSRPEPKPAIMEIALYTGGEAHIDGFDSVLKLSSNENPVGPCPSAMRAYAAVADQMHRYPSTDHADLRASIGNAHGLQPNRIICGVGSDELLSLICFAYAGQGKEIIYTEHGFSMYRILTLASGATPVKVAETNRQVDVDNILDAVTPKTSIVFVTNPGNPTGTLLPLAELERLAAELREDVLLVIDSAYAEYADGYDGGAGIVLKHENVVMTRTFSKLYGLGGLRVGWAYGPVAIIDVLNRVRGPFNLGLGQLAAAQAAVEDTEWATQIVQENTASREWLRGELQSAGLLVDESHTNFLLARFSDAEMASACDAELRRNGIIVRPVAGYGIPEGLRITVGTERDCRRVAAVVADFMEART